MSLGRRFRRASAAAAGLVAVAALVGGATASFRRHQRADVWVANELDVPVVVTVGRATGVVGPHAVLELGAIPKGAQHAVVKREDGRVVEEEDVVVLGGADATVLNVLGASPVFVEKVFYAARGKPPDSEIEVFAGQRFIVRDAVDDVFVDPPKTMPVRSLVGTASRTHVGRAPEGLDVTLGYLAKERPAEVGAFVARLALAEPESAAMTSRALDWLDRPEDQLAFLDRMVALRADDVELHRRRQSVLMTLGRAADAVREYEARFEADRSSVANAYLYAAILPRTPARALLENLRRDVPAAAEDLYVARLLGAIAFQEGRFDDAKTLFAPVARSPLHHRAVISEHAGALLVTDGPAGALAMLHGLAPEERRAPAFWVVFGQVVARARAAGVTGALGEEPASVVSAATSAEEWATLYADWGLEPPKAMAFDVPSSQALRIALAARKDPSVAIDLFREAAPQARAKVIPPVALLVAIEAGRRGDASLAREAYAVAEGGFGPDPPLEAFALAGRDDPPLDGEQMTVRALVELGRSRRESDPKKRAALQASARRDDPLLGLATDALASWPPP